MNDQERDELLIRLETKMDTTTDRLNDHGRRLKALEVFRSMAAGAGVITAMVIGWLKVKVSVQ